MEKADKVMYEQTIDKYYTNLEYHFVTKKEALIIIHNLSKQIKNKNINLSHRFFDTALIIGTHLLYFVPICKHIDVVIAIIEYLQYYGGQFVFNQEYDKAECAYKEHYIPISLMLTVFSMCREEAIILFLQRAIIDDSALFMSEIFLYYIKIMINESNQKNEMIILEDSDLYAVINCLMIMDNSCVNKIWIQESIRQKFLKLTKKYLNYFKCPIHTLRSQQELLLTFNTSCKSTMSTISIWSEDIVTAKNLASCLDGDIIFINTHMDFTGGILLVPFARIIDNLIDHIIMNSIDKTNLHIFDITPPNNAIKINAKQLTSNLIIHNLFYDGMWQKPVKGMYWKCIGNDEIFANATNDDIWRCVKSAEKGFEIWHAYTIASRIEILSKLAKTLIYYREFLLSTLVSKCMQFACLYENSNGYCTLEEKYELIITRKPKGIIILKEKNENTLFFRLMQSLLAGNSVIVIFNVNFCNLSQYFKMFSISGIPPGVINMLSSENITDLESRLCGTEYSIYAKRFFSEGNLIEKYINSYMQLSLPKQVVHPLK